MSTKYANEALERTLREVVQEVSRQSSGKITIGNDLLAGAQQAVKHLRTSRHTHKPDVSAELRQAQSELRDCQHALDTLLTAIGKHPALRFVPVESLTGNIAHAAILAARALRETAEQQQHDAFAPLLWGGDYDFLEPRPTAEKSGGGVVIPGYEGKDWLTPRPAVESDDSDDSTLDLPGAFDAITY